MRGENEQGTVYLHEYFLTAKILTIRVQFKELQYNLKCNMVQAKQITSLIKGSSQAEANVLYTQEMRLMPLV